MRGPLGHKQACRPPSASGAQPHRHPGESFSFPTRLRRSGGSAGLGDVLDIHRRLGQDVFERAAPAQTGPPPNPAQAERLPHSGTRLMPWPLPHRRSPAPVAIRRVASALMAMEALVQPRHIKVSRRFYVAQSFHPAMGDVLAGPVPDVALDPADRVVGRTASPPVLQRLTRGQYELLPGDQEYPWPTAGGGG